jgi:hypothetical protein
MPMPFVSALSGKLLTCSHVTLPSVLRHRPFLREPKYRTDPRLGSTVSRSPLPRPSSLPPILKVMGVICHVFPRSDERSIAPGPDQSFVYVPAAM